MNRDAERRLLVGESRNDFSRFSVPILNIFVVGDTVEPPTVCTEGDVPDRLIVSQVGPQALSLIVVVPDHDLAIHTSRKQKMSRLGKPSNLGHPHGVPCPGMDPLLGQETLLIIHVFGDVGLVLNPRSTSIVSLLVAMEDGSNPFLGLSLFSFHRFLFFGSSRDFLLSCLDLDLQLLPDHLTVDEAAPLL